MGELTIVIGKAFAVRTGGFYIVNLSQIAPALQLLYMVMVSNFRTMERPADRNHPTLEDVR